VGWGFDADSVVEVEITVVEVAKTTVVAVMMVVVTADVVLAANVVVGASVVVSSVADIVVVV